MLKDLFRRQTLRYSFFFFFALLLLFLLGKFSYFTEHPISVPSHPEDRSHEDSHWPDQPQRAKSAAKTALMNLPLSFEPAGAANQFFARGSGYRLLLTPSETTIALNHRAGQ